MTNTPTGGDSPAHDPRRKLVSVSQFVPASPQDIFDLLASPERHPEIDGSGTLRRGLKGPKRLSLGATFGMSMVLHVPYRITNTVVEFEEGQHIGWRHFGGHVWRYLLTPVEGGTLVTEQFDYSTNRANWFLRAMKAIPNNEVAMRKTLLNLAKRFS
ncbi:MAG: SRPBCC family protein [Ilumatobacteraceae bacterium]